MKKKRNTFSIKSNDTFDDFSEDNNEVEVIKENDEFGIKDKKISLTKKKYEFKNSLKTKNKELQDLKKKSDGKSRFELLKKKLAEKKKKMNKEKEIKKEKEKQIKKEREKEIKKEVKVPKLDLNKINFKNQNFEISNSESDYESINIKKNQLKKKNSKKKIQIKIESSSNEESFQITPRNLPKKNSLVKKKKNLENKENLEKKSEKSEETPEKKLKKMTTDEYEKKVLKINQMDLADMKKFVLNPPPKDKIIQVSILRDKSGFKNRFYPKFHVFFSENINYHIMSACKKPGNKSSNYILSLDKKDFSRKSKNCLGKLRSNFVGTEFYLYDKGENPNKKKKNPENIRSEFAFIKYQKNIFGMKGPRKLRITIPNYENNEYTKFQPISQNYGLSSASKIPNSKIKCFMNNPPQWSEEHEAFVLDFYNRVEQASVKNFQLIEVGDGEKEVFLQFGKIDNNIYNLDFKYPFSLMQAVSISLSSCDNKLFCE